MPWQASVYTVPLVLSALLGAATAVLLWRERPRRGATWLALSAVALTVWALGEALVVSNTATAVQHLGGRVALVGAVFVPTLFLLFTLGYTGRDEGMGRGVVGLLVAEPVVVGALVLAAHPVVTPARTFDFATEGVGALGLDLLGAHYLYGNVLLVLCSALLVRKFLGSRNVFRRRTFFLLALIAGLHACTLVTTFGYSPTPHMSLTPLGYLLFGTVSVLVIVSYRSLSFLPLQRLLAVVGQHSKRLAPLARDRAIEEMSPGFLVIDHDGRVVDTNPAGKRLFGQSADRIVGKRLGSVVDAAAFVDGPPEFLRTEPGTEVGGRYTGLWVESDDGERRCFDVLVSTLGEDGEPMGYVALVYEVTERERSKQKLQQRTRELERQNDQLEEFAGIVSHDLRNPLNVASGRLDLVDAGTDQEHVEHAQDALDRMEAIVDDVLTYARLGQTIEGTERVALAGAVRDAWANVETREATLAVETDQTVDASRSRLLQVFENLVRNAVEHGGPGVRVTVGDTGDGFFVADDGPGIPEGEREAVLEQGYSTEEDGTGFGLSIVRTIVEAHGWTVRVTESEAGGARFEVAVAAADADAELPVAN